MEGDVTLFKSDLRPKYELHGVQVESQSWVWAGNRDPWVMKTKAKQMQESLGGLGPSP